VNETPEAPPDIMNRPLATRLVVLARRRNLWIALGLTLLCVITRLLATPASLWEWDDILFAKAIDRFDLVAHSPHPPGFPVFVMMARAAHVFFHDNHQALVAVNLIFSSLLGAALYYFFCEVFRDQWMALAGALMSFLVPNVWIHSGAARSDSPALTLGLIGLGLVLHGLRSRRSLWLGCAVFGLAMGVRVTILPVMAPVLSVVLFVHLRHRRWRVVAVALAIAVGCILCWYIPLVLHTTWRVFRQVMNQHAQFTFAADTIVSPTENAILTYRLRRFFVEIWGAQWIMLMLYALGFIGLLASVLRRQWWIVGWMFLAFLPFLIFTLMLNTPLSAPLYSLPYIPFFTGMAAVGVVSVGRAIFGTRRLLGNLMSMVMAVGLTFAIARWGYPVVRMLHRETSPPVRAVQYVRDTLNPAADVLYFDGLFGPHVSFFLHDFRAFLNNEQENAEGNLIDPVVTRGRIYRLTTEPPLGIEGHGFHWTRESARARLRPVSLGRYFDAYVTDLTATSRMIFLSGWYEEEHFGSDAWRWMSGQGRIALLGSADVMTLRLKAALPLDKPEARPTVILRLDDREIDRFTADGVEIDRTIQVRPDPTRLWSTLVIETNQVVIPSRIAKSGDDRELGLRWQSLQWAPAANATLVPRSAEQYLGTGWYPIERDTNDYYWRWIKDEGIAYLPAIHDGAQLDLKLLVPDREDGTRSELIVTMAGKVIDRILPPSGNFFRSYFVPVSFHRDARTELRISAKGLRVPEDPRMLAVQVFYLGWRPSTAPPGQMTSGVTVIAEGNGGTKLSERRGGI
jgi:hypothetical protein